MPVHYPPHVGPGRIARLLAICIAGLLPSCPLETSTLELAPGSVTNDSELAVQAPGDVEGPPTPPPEAAAAQTPSRPSTVEEDPGEWPSPPVGSADPGPAPALGPAPSQREAASEAAPPTRELVAPKLDSDVDPERALTAIRKETYVFSKPNWRSRKLGYLRAGALVSRGADPARVNKGCRLGWYEIEPEGFVCVGKTASIDPDDPVARAARRPPDRSKPLPYDYGISRYPTPPFYVRVPTEKQQRKVEKGLTKHLGLRRNPWPEAPLGPVPGFLKGAVAPTLHGYSHSPSSIYSGRGLPQSGFAFLGLFSAEGRRWGLSTDLSVMPLDRMKPVKASAFHGLVLDDETTLPVVFVKSRAAMLFEGDPLTTGLRAGKLLGFRDAVPITGKRVNVGGAKYLQTRSGHWLRDQGLVRIDPIKKRPGWATPGRTWLEVSILEQSLVAYVGLKPVYVTLVSTGADGLGDPEETHSTVRGQFLVHTKHVTVTMSGDEVGDEFDLRDVPYVQYFSEGYALHAAYWHDAFGKPRSHGCVNLAPEDARWLFGWTDPPVPDRWHGAMSLREGTLISIHP